MHLLDEVHDVGCPLERLCQDLGPASQVAEVGDQGRTAATVSLRQIYGNHGESCHPPKKITSFGMFWCSQFRDKTIGLLGLTSSLQC